MSRPHRILKIRRIIRLIAQHADSALRQIGIAAFKIRLCYEHYLPVLRNLQCKIQGCAAAADDQYVCLLHSLFFLRQSAAILCQTIRRGV